MTHTSLEGIAETIGAGAMPSRGPFLDMGVTRDGRELAKAARARRDEVQAAFVEGCITGSVGFMTRRDCEEPWRYSKSRKSLIGNPPGADVIGHYVLCSDPRAAGRETWRIIGLDGAQAWIRSDDIRLDAAIESLRWLINGRPITSERLG